MNLKLGYKTRKLLEAVAEISKMFATINLVLLLGHWIGIVTLNDSYTIKGIFGVISMIGLYILSVAVHLYLLKDE